MFLSGHGEEGISSIHEVAIDELVWVSGVGQGGGGAHVWRLEVDHKEYLDGEGVHYKEEEWGEGVCEIGRGMGTGSR